MKELIIKRNNAVYKISKGYDIQKSIYLLCIEKITSDKNIFVTIKPFPLNLRAYVLSQRGYLTSAYPLRTMYSLYILIF